MPLPSPQQLKSLLPLLERQSIFIEKSRETLQNILNKKENKIAFVLGPCSIHDMGDAIEYAKKLKKLSIQIEKNSFVVMRVFVEKPRTVTGWKGLLYDPHLDNSNDLMTGIVWTRRLLLDLASLEIPAAVEFLDPLASTYFEDLVSWGFIGARTSSSQIHRQLASYLPMPIGFKNGIDGNIEQAINGMMAARAPHSFLHINQKARVEIAQSEGNFHTHLVLRGSGEGTNYDLLSIQGAQRKIKEINPSLCNSILIDCSHGNCQKEYTKQKEVFQTTLLHILKGNRNILGMMLESNLLPGDQRLSPSSLKPGVSITDPCLGWEESEALLSSASETLSSSVMSFTHS